MYVTASVCTGWTANTSAPAAAAANGNVAMRSAVQTRSTVIAW